MPRWPTTPPRTDELRTAASRSWSSRRNRSRIEGVERGAPGLEIPAPAPTNGAATSPKGTPQMFLHLSNTNLVLIVVGLVLAALNAAVSSRMAPVIAGLFARRLVVRRHALGRR